MPTEHQLGQTQQSSELKRAHSSASLGTAMGNYVVLPHNTKLCTGRGTGLFWKLMGRICSMRREKKKNLNCMQLLLLRKVAMHPWEISSLVLSTGRRMKVEVPVSSQRQMWHFRGRGIQGNNKIWGREQGRILENEREGRSSKTAIKGMKNGGQGIHKPRWTNKMAKTREEKEQHAWVF